MNNEKGNISIHSENILPIIKKWLYSDRDIFIREMISNACDAINKHKRLVAMGEAQMPEGEKYRIDVKVDKKAKTLTFNDNGIGMSAEEIKKYINQIAFSGALDFMEKYKDKIGESGEIIGHFGLGFYSAFMVAEKVDIDTRSYRDEDEAVKWTSAGGVEYEMSSSDRDTRGSLITLYINDENKDFLDEFKVKEILMKYCSFMPFEIFVTDVQAAEKAAKEAAKKAKKEKAEAKEKAESKDKAEVNVEESAETKSKESADNEADSDNQVDDEADNDDEDNDDMAVKETPINDTQPLWAKKPSDCTDEEYKAFYHKVFTDFNEPLFWIHLNMDYPFRLNGILYFPKLKHEFEPNEGQIKLYNNQVFVADNIKEVIPEFLLMLKGTIDCPDLPLNVSRSFLQNDGQVAKLSQHIIKKVSDKLSSLFKKERESFNKYWDDIHPFVKYGCMREDKFYDRVKDILIYKTTKGEYVTLKDYLEKNSAHKDTVYYVSDEKQQAQYIRLFNEHGMEAVVLSSLIDSHFIQFMEMKQSGTKFARIDADISDSMKDSEEPNEDTNKIKEDLEKIFKEALENDKMNIKVEALKSTDIPAIILLSEQSRRMQDMSRMFGGMNFGASPFPLEETLVLNSKNTLVNKLISLYGNEDKKEDAFLIGRHIYDLALMSHKQLEPEAMAKFIERSNTILARLS